MKAAGNICIIGGGGFIGQGLRKVLSASGHSVTIIGRTLNIGLAPNEKFYSIREYSFRELATRFQDEPVEAIIDLAYASVPNTSYADPVGDFSDNLRNVILHLDFANNLKAKRFVYVSSGGTVYGDASHRRPFTEDDPNFPLSPYGITKMACERYVYMYHRLHGLPSIIVRPSNIYGPGQKPFRGQGLAATALGIAYKGEPIHIFGSGSNVRDYLFIEDFCAGLLRLLEDGVPGEIYNLGYGEGHAILDIINCIDEVIAADGLTLRREYHPERPFDVHYNVLDISKVNRTVGWAPHTSLLSGIRQTWQWIQQYMRTNP